jgi:nucleotide-binding universal stress UspA family protein
VRTLAARSFSISPLPGTCRASARPHPTPATRSRRPCPSISGRRLPGCVRKLGRSVSSKQTRERASGAAQRRWQVEPFALSNQEGDRIPSGWTAVIPLGVVLMSAQGTAYSTVVIGIDGSDRATVAFRDALALAKLSGAKLHVVQVVHPAVPAGFSNSYQSQLALDRDREEADRVGEQALAEAEREGVAAEIHHPGGDAADGILAVAEATGADLIVIGNRGMTGAKRFVLGSVPNSVAHRSPCSVLIVNTDREG